MAFEAGIVVNIDSRRAKQGSKEVEQSFDRMKKAANDSIKSVEASTSGFASRTVGAFQKVYRALTSLKSGIVGIIASIAAGFGLRTAARFEDLRDSLIAVTGSADAANKAFKFIQQAAASMPVDIERVTKSFITLKASGIEPTMEQLTLFSDVASVTTNSIETFDTMVRIFSRGVQGSLQLEDLNQIADRGIPIWKLLQEKLGKTRLELSQLGSTTDGAIRILNALNEGLNETYGGATARKLDNLTTKWSNFTDQLAITAAAFTEASGLADAAKWSLDALTTAMQYLVKWYELLGRTSSIVWAEMGQAIENVVTGQFSKLWEQMKGLPEVWDKIAKASKDIFDQQNAAGSGAAAGKSGGKGLVITNPSGYQGISKNQLEVLGQLDALKQRNEAITQGNKALEQFDKMIARKSDVEAFRKSAEAAGYYGDTLNGLVDQYREARDQADQLTESSARFNEVASGVGDALGTAFEDAVTNGNSFLDVLKNLENQLLKIGNEQFINKPLNNWFSSLGNGSGGGGGGLSGMFGSLFGSGGGSNVLSSGALDTFFQAYHSGGIVGEGGSPRRVDPRVFAHAPRMHSGGMVPGEVPIIAKKGERVLTKDQQKNMGRAVNVTLNVSGVTDAGSFVKNEGKVLAAASRALALANARNN